MRGITHLLFGLIIATVVLQYHSFSNPVLALVLILLASILPDVDERNSTLGKKVPFIGWFVRHRTFFHSIFFGVLVVIILSFALSSSYALAFGAGFVSHLVLDALTPMGVQPFWPSKLKIKGFVRTGGVVEKIIFAVAILLFIWLLLR